MNKPINTQATGNYDKKWSGGPISRGSFEPFGGKRYDPNFERVTTKESTYLKDYQPEELKGAYVKSNQNKSL